MKIKPYIEETISLLDSESMVDVAYSGLISILDLIPSRGMQIEGDVLGGKRKHMSHFYPIHNGIYIPGSKRCFWVGRFDVGVDALPETGSVYVVPDENERFAWVTVRNINRLPRGVYTNAVNPVLIYEVTVAKMLKSKPHMHKCSHKDRPLDVEVSYFTIDFDGSVNATIDTQKLRWFTATADAYNGHRYGAGALSILADRKYLWLVDTSEQITGFGSNQCSAKVQFGVEESYIKSLLYARSLPMTSTNRKRPILHWVQSHKRMVQLGTEVDVSKHLRGIDSLVMGDLHFKISQPNKAEVSEQLKRERAARIHSPATSRVAA